MPKVGKKHFSYGKKGKSAAKKYAKKTGKKISYYGGGGKVKKRTGRKRRK
tara:strand:- start:2513 stop:2662 length:150 start_codon:yes stop_codon:yes gene_type:complete